MEEKEKPTTSRGGTVPGYSVEARCADKCGPTQVGKQIFDGEWRRVQFESGPVGVPTGSEELKSHGLYSYQAAQALRWWFCASAGAFWSSMETRLVLHEVRYSSASYKRDALEALSWNGKAIDA